MGALTLSGVLQVGPANPVDGGFPGASENIPIGFISGTKQYVPGTGVLTRNVASPGAFLALDGVGPAAAVTQGTFLYFKCNTPVILQLTCDDGLGPAAAVTQGTFLYFKSNTPVILQLTCDDGLGSTVVIEQPVQGMYMLEFPSSQPLELLKIKGSATIEYLVVGNT